MQTLPPVLYHRLRKILLGCDEFRDITSLRTLFVVDVLIPFIHKLPSSATNDSDRVDKCLELLVTSQFDNNKPVLPVFLAILREKYRPGDARHRDIEKIRIEIETLDTSQFPFRQPERLQPLYELVQAWNFDLTKPIRRCVNEFIKRKNGVFGFAIPYDDLKCLEYLCNRLRDEWGREKFSYTFGSLKIDPISQPVNKAVDRVMRYKNNVAKGNVLFGILAAQADMGPFWQALNSNLRCETLSHRLIVILATSAVESLPEEIIPLPPPFPEPSDIHAWVKDVVKGFHLPEHIIDPWRDLILQECCEGETVSIHDVYMHIEYILPRLRIDPSIHCFQEILEERNVSYVQTSD